MDLVLLLLLGLLLFGAKRLPDIARSLGSGLRELKDAVGGEGGLQEAVKQVVEIRDAASPSNIARKAIMGPSEGQGSPSASERADTDTTR